MSGIPVERRFGVLCDITRAQHFAWREAVARLDGDPRSAVEQMWLVTGEQTARAYLKRIDPEAPLPEQVARSIAWSSECMGEDAAVEIDEDGKVFLRHVACPWKDWHEKMDLLEEDRFGCDAWFRGMLGTINDSLGTALRFETLETLPEGAPSCLRRLWVEG